MRQLHDGEVSLTAEIANDYCTLRAAQDREWILQAEIVRQIGVATAGLYPKFNLLAGVSFASNRLSNLFSTSNLGELGPGSIMWPVFNASSARLAEAQYRVGLVPYLNVPTAQATLMQQRASRIAT
ncbi:MAG: hypothetical protein WDN03_18425 [Rhizomicrobium sp.]